MKLKFEFPIAARKCLCARKSDNDDIRLNTRDSTWRIYRINGKATLNEITRLSVSILARGKRQQRFVRPKQQRE